MNRQLFALALTTWSVLAGAFALPTRAQGTGDALTQCQEEFKIDLLNTLDVLPDAAPDAQLDQIRDWIWTTVLARIAAQSQQPELLASVARQPLFRDDSLSHLLEQPVGRTRAAVGKDGTVHVMVDRSTPEQEKEDILEAIDQEAFYLGETPRAVQVYAVKLLMGTAEAEICRLGLVDTKWVQAAEQGFRNARVTTADQLGVFLDGGVDLLAASCHTDRNGKPFLDVSGRRRARAAGAPISVAHVATLARKVKYVPLSQLPVSASRLSEEERTWVKKMAQVVDSVPPEDLRRDLPKNPDIQQFLETVLAWKKQQPRVPTDQLMLSLRAQGGGGLGFSLDPKTDIPGSVRLFDQLLLSLPSATRLSSVLESWRISADQQLEVAEAFVSGASLKATREGLVRLRDRVMKEPSKAEAHLLRAVLFDDEDPVLRLLVHQVLLQSQYQVARYDGPLQGTEAAMTMFYADLIAKIWALDWEGSSPRSVIPGFVSVIADRGSVAHCEEDQKVPATRIWFGSRPEGYARNRISALQFAPNATRLYAKGSALGSDHSGEVEPSSEMLRFIHWWDSHYSDVATWEPQYDLLNQLIKWTLVRGMAETAGQPGCLAFLDTVGTGRTWRFNEWVKDRRGLRWRGEVPFAERPDEPTEALKIVESDPYETCGGVGILSGGITLPTGEVATRPVRKISIDLYSRRLALEKQATRSPSGGLSISAIDVPKGKLLNMKVAISPEGARASADLASSVGRRWADGFADLGKTNEEPIAWSKDVLFGNAGGQVEARESQEGFGIGRLLMEDLPGQTVKIDAVLDSQLDARQWAREISFRLQSEGGDLKSAAKEAVGDMPVMSLDDDMVVIGFVSADGNENTYAILKSGGGIRGPPPPPPGVRFIAGAPEPPRGGGSGSDGILGVLIAKETDAKPYLKKMHAAIVAEPDPAVVEVRSLVKQGDLANAFAKAESPGAPPRAIAVLAVDSLEKGNLDIFKASVDRLLQRSASAPDLLQVQKAVLRKQIEFARESRPESSLLLAIQTRLSIAASRLPAREAAREVARWKGNPPKVFYAPKGFRPLAEISEVDLPPVGHSPSETSALDPDNQYVIELVAGALRWNDSPARDLGDFKLRSMSNPHGEDIDGAGSTPGVNGNTPPLPGLVQPLYVVVPCHVEADDEEEEDLTHDDDETPSCFRPNGEPQDDPDNARQMHQLAEKLFECDQDGSGELDEMGSLMCLLKIAAEQESSAREHPMP